MWLERVTHCHCIVSHPITLLPHFTLHHSTSNTISDIIPNHTTVPHHTIIHHHITPAPQSRSTLFHFAIPCFKSHHIGHIMHHTTSRTAPHFHITDVPYNATFQTTPYIIYASHHHFAQDIAPHFTCSTSCIIPPHVAVITPTGNSTSHYHVSHSIRHHPSVHHHFLHLATCHISHNTTTTYQSRRITHSLIPHRATFHISCHSTRTSPYYTTTFHNPLPV